MGKGRFIGTGLDLYVSLDYDASSVEDGVENVFQTFSGRFFQACDGQLHIANIFWIDNNAGKNIADVFCRQNPDNDVLGQAIGGSLGIYAGWMEIFDFSGFSPTKNETLGFVFMHELGHYIWGLGEEYGGPLLSGPIDQAEQQAYDQANAPDFQRLFLAPDFNYNNSVSNEPYDLQNCTVRVLIDGVWNERISGSYQVLPGGTIALDIFGTFNAAPSTSTQDPRIRPAGLCGYQGQDFCIMNGRGGDEGRREFCGIDNHDPDRLTDQSARHGGLPCWNVIAQDMAERWEVAVDPQLQGDPGTGSPPAVNIQRLVNEHRYVLVLDRSGSMGDDEKIEGARGGLDYWISSAQGQGEFLGIVWFNSNVTPVQPIANIADIPDIEAVKDDVLTLEPDGATNIKDALHAAADMLIAEADARGPAMIQYIVLMTDGVHNVPSPSTVALDAVPKCQENGIQIFTLGLGSPENVDFTVLEDLAYSTAGKPSTGAIGAIGENQTDLVFDALYRLKLEIQGIFTAEIDLDFDELIAKSAFDGQMRKWVRADERPSLKGMVEAAEVENLDELVKNKGRFATTSMWVEKGARFADFGIAFPEKQPVWLYLIDPQGTVLTPDDLTSVRGRYPFEGAIVKDPARGRWTVLAVRLNSGPAFRAKFKGGIENPELVVSGDSDKVVPLGNSARFRANAYWNSDLSGLHVSARLRDPQGGLHTVLLSDETAEDPYSSHYQGFFTPTVAGRHEGEIRIANRGGLKLGNGIDRLVHMGGDVGKDRHLKLDLERDHFQRTIKIYFDAGARPKPRDREKASGAHGKYRALYRRKSAEPGKRP